MDTLALNIRIRYATLILGLLITVVVTVWVYKTTDTPQPKDIVPVAAALIAMTALVYAAMSFHVNVQLNEIKLLQDKKQFSLSLISEWHKPDMAKLTIIGAALRKEIKDLQPKEVVGILSNDKEKLAAIVATLNFLEKLALSIQVGVADEHTLREFFGSIVRLYYHALKGFIEHKRQELNNTRIFIQFEELAQRWERQQ